MDEFAGLGGFSPTNANAQVGIVLGNHGRTLLNGFFLPEISDQSFAAQFAPAELNFFFTPSPPFIVLSFTPDRQSVTLTFDSAVGVNYQVERSSQVAGPWRSDGGSVTADGSEKTVALPIIEPRQFYRLCY